MAQSRERTEEVQVDRFMVKKMVYKREADHHAQVRLPRA